MVFLHGGPGAGTSPTHRRYFDPAHYRIVLFDQRGAGKSTPPGHIEANSTAHLIADMEKLRTLLGIGSWWLFGGSWGSALALAYGVAHPARCRGFVLRGMFLGRRTELDWFLTGMKRIFPEPHRRFVEFVPAAERGDLLTAYFSRLTDPEPAVHLPAARAWSAYEGACSTLLPSPDTVTAFQQDRMALGLARIEAHYFRHDMYLDGAGPVARHREASPSALHHCPGPLRCGVPDRDGGRGCPGLARSHLYCCARRRPFGDGAGHPPRAAGNDGTLQKNLRA